jgi:hypothetical protein
MTGLAIAWIAAGQAVASLPPDAVRETVLRGYPALKACYDEARDRRPTLEGRFVAKLVVAPSGRVESAGAQKDELGDDDLRECLLAEMRDWLFPRPRARAAVVVPLRFQPNR